MVTVETVTMSTAPLLIALISETVLPVVNDLPQSLAHLCAGLSARGHQLQLVRPRQAEDQDRHSDERLLLTRGWMLPGLPGWQWGVSLQAKLQRHWRRKRPDVLYIATAGPLGLAALRAGRQLGIPVVSSLTEQVQALTHGHSLSPFYRLFDHYLRWFHNRSQLTLVPTSSQLQTLQRRGFEHLQLLTSGVDSHLFHPRQRDNALRSRYPQRRLKLLLLDDDPHDATPGALVDSLQVEAADAASLATLMASTDLLLLAQPGAVADNMVLQALASGLGIVAFDQGAAAQHIRHGHNGALALPDDADSFATATTWLLEDPETLRRVRLNACQYAGRHSWSNISQHLEGYLCSACASPWPN